MENRYILIIATIVLGFLVSLYIGLREKFNNDDR